MCGPIPRQMVSFTQYIPTPIMHTSDHQASNPTQPDIQIGKYDSRYGVDPINRHLVRGYTEMVTDRIDDGWTCNLVTFLFSQRPGRRPAVISQMKDEIQRVYSTLVTRVHRKPRTASPDDLPLMIAAADLPVHKRDRSSSPTVLCNGGLHFHAVLLIPLRSRLDGSFEDHFRSNQAMYCGKRRAISAIHVEQVTGDHERVVDYVLKTVLRGSVSYDEGVLLLPRASQELASDRPIPSPGFTQ